MDSRGKKTAAAILEEITREIDQWLHVLFNGRRKTGHVDLEASEMMMRSAMHRVGAAGLTQLLRFPVPSAEQRTLPWPYGSLPGVTFQTHSLGSRQSRSIASLLSVLALL